MSTDSTPTTVRKDESLRTAPFPSTASEEKAISQWPTPSLEVSEPSVGKTPAPADPGAELPPTEIPLLGPVPANFGPAYGYLGEVKELADKIAPDLYEKYFEQRFPKGRIRIGLYDHSGAETIMHFGTTAKGLFRHVRGMQKNFDDSSKKGQTALLVEAINKAGVQAIGMAFNVNPCFFAAHLLPKDHSLKWTAELTELGKIFESDVLSRTKVGSQVADGMRYWAAGNAGFVSMENYTSTTVPAEGRRITIGNEIIGFCSRLFDALRVQTLASPSRDPGFGSPKARE
jgi:hypothetical protein